MKFKFLNVLSIFLSVLCCSAYQASPALSSPLTLFSGINLAYLLEDPENDEKPVYPASCTGTIPGLSGTISTMKNHGVKVVRLPISAFPFLPSIDDGSGNYHILADQNYLKCVDTAIGQLISGGLTVVVNMRFETPEQQNFLYLPQSYGDMWNAFAGHLASKFNPQKLLLELTNEPTICAPNCTSNWTDIDVANAKWSVVQNIWVRSVRAAAPNNTIVLTPDNRSDFEYLVRMKISSDKNVIYTFHYYNPEIFALQGLTVAGQPNFTQYSPDGLDYPANTTNCNTIEANAIKQKNSGLVPYVQAYCSQWTSKARIGTDFSVIANWAAQNKVTVWAGEWGAFPSGGMNSTSRKQYLKDMVSIFSEYNIGWSAWEYVKWLSQFQYEDINSASGFPKQ